MPTPRSHVGGAEPVNAALERRVAELEEQVKVSEGWTWTSPRRS